MLVQLLVSMKMVSFNGGALGFVFTNSLYSGVFAMVGGLVIVPIVSLFTAKKIPENTDEMFACYDTEITVPVSKSLNEN